MAFDENIASLRPKRGHGVRYKQGYVNPETCEKLFESQRSKPIIYRSSWELQFIKWLERSSIVVNWASECVKINYVMGMAAKHYYPDFYVTFVDGTKALIEIKPLGQTKKPSDSIPKNSFAWKTYVKNIYKWKAAKEFCDRHGLKFMILTEKTIEKLAYGDGVMESRLQVSESTVQPSTVKL